MKFYNGEIVKFEYRDKPKKSWFYKYLIKTDDKYYICSYINQGDIKHQYELKSGDIFIVRVHILGLLGIEPLSPKIQNDIYYIQISNKEDIFSAISESESKKMLRKEKLKQLKQCQ